MSPLRSTISVFSSFSWEEEEGGGASSSSSSLLAVGVQGEVTLLRVEAEPSSSIRVIRVSGCPAERLLQTVREQDPDVRELQSVHMLSFAAGRGRVLLNRDWLLQLRWRQMGEEPQPEEEEPQPEEEEPQTESCCSIRQSDDSSRSSVHHCVCSDFLFVLSATGLIDHLLCAAAPLRPPIQNPLRFQTPTDQDGLSSAVCSLSGLGAAFSADR
ncbi:hypothetical protein EYF80_064809 [Liparis tanakae]|uniref:Uncharacterized protein n=1 Tax=Liparis tanakae TaxID=230148 RepID=A0A4Z2E962_9TELE|nr:hypothetical protein EYF80_064809 [Liparis tanakae]